MITVRKELLKLSSFAGSRFTGLQSIISVINNRCTGDVDWTVSGETAAPRSWAIIEALSPETVYEMRVVARSATAAVESASFIQRVRIGLKRGNHSLFLNTEFIKHALVAKELMSMSMSKTFTDGAVCREFESEAPAAEEMLD